MSGTALKWIAVISMLVDHTAEVLMNHNEALTAPVWTQIYGLMRGIGRLAFPIYAFLLVEGFCHTRNARNYLTRLLVSAALSEIPFDLAVFHTPFYPGYQNVFFTLALGLIALIGIRKTGGLSLYDQIVYGRESGQKTGKCGGWWKQLLIMAVCSGIAEMINSDYGGFGVIFIILLSMTRYDKKNQTLLGAVSLVWELPAIFAFVPIWFYNGTRGRDTGKYFFYAFYPVHLLILWAVGRYLFHLF